VGYEVGHLGAILHLCSQQPMMVQSWLLSPWDDFVIQKILLFHVLLFAHLEKDGRQTQKEALQRVLPFLIL